MLMGGGGSFSTGGPGKGMYSRLCKLLAILAGFFFITQPDDNYVIMFTVVR